MSGFPGRLWCGRTGRSTWDILHGIRPGSREASLIPALARRFVFVSFHVGDKG